jgi:hypothetical protein
MITRAENNIPQKKGDVREVSPFVSSASPIGGATKLSRVLFSVLSVIDRFLFCLSD